MPAGWMPGVRYHPLNTGHAAIQPECVVVHSVAGSAQSAENYFSSGATNLGSHFITFPNGDIVQLESIFVAMYANFDANWYGVSIENGNVRPDGSTTEGFNADRFWTPEQLDAVVRICRFCNSEAGVPLRKATSARSGGIGYHRQFPEWNGTNAGAGSTDCPGDTRVAQFDAELIPALAGLPEGALSMADIQVITDKLNQISAQVETDRKDTESRFNGLRVEVAQMFHDLNVKVDGIRKDVRDDLQVDLAAIAEDRAARK